MIVDAVKEQMALMLKSRKEEVADSVVLRCKSLEEAVSLCITTSGRPVKDVAYYLGYAEHPEQLSRMLSGTANFPAKLLNSLQDFCCNEIPIRWLALSRGYGLHRLKSDLELENEFLKAELDEERKKMSVIKDFLKEVKP